MRFWKENRERCLECLGLAASIAIITLLFLNSSRPMEPVRMGVAAVLLYAGGWNLYKNRGAGNKRIAAGICILAVALALMTVAGSKIHIGDWNFEKARKSDLFWIALYSLVFCVMMGNLFLLTERESVGKWLVRQRDYTKTEFSKVWLAASILLAIFWIPVFTIYFPGIVADDSTISIAMFFKEMPWDNHFPVFYSLIVGGLVKLGGLLGNHNLGVALYSAIQMVIMAAGLGYFLAWLWEKGVHRLYVFGSAAFFASAPLFGNYAIVMWKDPVFSLLLLLMVLFLFDHVAENKEGFLKKKNIVKYILLSIGICLMRNNGIYIVALLAVGLMVIYRKHWKRAAIACFVGILISMVVTGPIYSKVFSAENLFVESLGVPLQQMARVVVTGGEMTQGQREYMDSLLPIEQYQELYNPHLIDPIKWAADFDNEFLESHKAEFFETWLQMLAPNFKAYVEAYLMETLSFWRIGEEIPYEMAKTDITENTWGIYSYMPVENMTGYQILEEINQKYDFIPTALPIWGVFICGVFCLMGEKKRYIIPLVPFAGTWLTMMVATPTAFGLRYVFIYAIGLPLIVIYMWLAGRKKFLPKTCIPEDIC